MLGGKGDETAIPGVDPGWIPGMRERVVVNQLEEARTDRILKALDTLIELQRDAVQMPPVHNHYNETVHVHGNPAAIINGEQIAKEY